MVRNRFALPSYSPNDGAQRRRDVRKWPVPDCLFRVAISKSLEFWLRVGCSIIFAVTYYDFMLRAISFPSVLIIKPRADFIIAFKASFMLSCCENASLLFDEARNIAHNYWLDEFPDGL